MWLVKERNETSSIVAGWKRHAFRPVNLAHHLVDDLSDAEAAAAGAAAVA
jgi:hypothetical protein